MRNIIVFLYALVNMFQWPNNLQLPGFQRLNNIPLGQSRSRPMTGHPSLVGVLANLLGGALVTLVGGGAIRHLDDWGRRTLYNFNGLGYDPETSTAARSKNELTDAVLKVGLSGATVAGVGHVLKRRRKTLVSLLEDRNSKTDAKFLALQATHKTEVFHLQQALASKDLQLNETNSFLLEAQSSLRETQRSLGELQTRYDTFVWIALVLLVCIVVLVMLGLQQSLTHHQERHQLTVHHNTEREQALQEKLRQQQTSLNAALEERKLHVQLAQSLRALPAPASVPSSFFQQGQPIIFQVPTGLGAACASTSTSVPTAFAERSHSGFSAQHASS